MSSLDDSSVLYVIETEGGNKRTLVDAYGTYSESISPEMAQKLREKYYYPDAKEKLAPVVGHL
ncbi:MAG: hypothetical protein AAF694_22730 [Bacteroidota bacterium]